MNFLTTILARLALLLDGQWRDLAGRIESAAWSFAPGGKLLLGVGALVAIGLAWLCYHRTTEGLTPRMRVTMGLLRAVAVLALLAMAAGTVCHLHVIRAVRAEALVVLDDSASMQLAAGGMTRLAAAEAALAPGGALAHLGSAYDLRVVRTSQALAAGAAPELPQDLASALVCAAAAESPNWPPAQLILVSDGIQAGREPLVAAATLVGAPVSTVACGAAADVRDLILRGVTVPAFAYAKDRVLVTADVRALGITGEATLRLTRLDGTSEADVVTVKVPLAPDGTVAKARLEFVAGQPGLQRYALSLVPMPGEQTPANNALHFYLDTRAEKIRVLFVEGQPGWEYRAAKTALAADPAVTFHGLVRLPPDEWFYQGPDKRDDGRPVLRNTRSGFPDGNEELAYFDVLVLGDLERKTFEEGKRFDLVDLYVRERGGGLGTIGGLSVYSAGHYDDTSLARLLPFRLANEKTTQLVNRFQVQLSPEGLTHPILQLETDPARNAEAWAGLPWVEGGNAISRVKPSATQLLMHPTLKTRYGPRPVAAAWDCGRGRVYSTALDGTWHWSMARKTEVDYHQRYWGLLVRWLAGDPRVQRSQALILETPVCEAGKPLTLSISLRNAAGLPLPDAEVVLGLAVPGGENMTAPLLSDPANPGRYALTFTPRVAGEYAVNGQCRLADGTLLTRALRVSVDPSREELLQVRPDAEALRALATATGGQATTLAAAGALRLPAPPVLHQAATLTLELWHAPGLALLLIGCALSEWALRKRRGLA